MVSPGLLAALLSGASASSTHAEHAATFGALPPRPRVAAQRAAPPPAAPSVTVYGYLPYWIDGVTAEELAGLTRVAVFSVGVESDGSLSSTSSWTSVASEVVTAAHAAGVEVDLCVTNFDSSSMSALLGSSSARAAAVASLASLVSTYGGDGVNVDFEGLPASQSANFVTFIRALQAAVGEVYLATPAVDWSGAYDYSELSDAADGLFIMGYDFHWSGSDPGPGDPLYASDLWGSYALDWTIDDYLYYGADAEKIILGLPLYGRWWPSTSCEVPGTATDSGSAVLMNEALGYFESYGSTYEDQSHSPYACYGGGQLWSNDLDSLRERIAWGVGLGLQGVGFWALGYEDGISDFWPMMAEETVFGGGEDTGTEDTGSGETDTASDDTASTGEVPVARAGVSFMAYPGDTVILDGSGSSDPNGGDLKYRWSQVGGDSVDLADGSTANPSFVAGDPGTLTFELVVNSGARYSEPDDVDVVVVDGSGAKTGGCSTGSGGARWVGVLGVLALGCFRRRRTSR